MELTACVACRLSLRIIFSMRGSSTPRCSRQARVSVHMAPPTPSTMGLDRVFSSIVHPSPLNNDTRFLCCSCFTGISHFNDMDFRVFFNILKVVYKFGHSGIP